MKLLRRFSYISFFLSRSLSEISLWINYRIAFLSTARFYSWETLLPRVTSDMFHNCTLRLRRLTACPPERLYIMLVYLMYRQREYFKRDIHFAASSSLRSTEEWAWYSWDNKTVRASSWTAISMASYYKTSSFVRQRDVTKILRLMTVT